MTLILSSSEIIHQLRIHIIKMRREEKIMLWGSVLGNIFTLPLDFIKTQKQVENPEKSFKLRKYFTGTSIVVLRSTIYSSLLNFLYSSPVENYKIGLIAGASAIYTILTPLDHILVKLQTSHIDPDARSIARVARRIVAGGIGKMYLGYQANFLKSFSIFSTALITDTAFYPYESLRFKWYFIWFIQIPIAVVSLPFDMIKTQYQRCYADPSSTDSRAYQCLIDIYNKQGISAFYRGLSFYYLRGVIPCMGLTSIHAYYGGKANRY